MKRKALGKGLSALIPQSVPTGSEKLERLPIGQIHPSPQQPRLKIENDSLKELASSITSQGVLMPILVRPSAIGYEIVAGERRWRAAKIAGEKHIPAVIKNISDPEALEIALIENLQREDLNPLEIALGYKRLIDRYGFTQEELSQKLGQGRTTVSNILRLLKLPDEVQELVRSGKLSVGHAKVLLGLPSKKQMITLAKLSIEKDWSVRTLENYIQQLKSNKNKSSDHNNFQDPVLVSILDRLKRRFSTNISLKINKKGKGSIVLEFYSQEDLTRIIELLNGGSF